MGTSQAPILESTGASFYAPDDSLAVAYDDQRWLDDWDVSDDQLVEVEEGDTFDVGEFTVHVEAAHDADATHPVSYVIEHGSTTFFHGGDTKPGDELDAIGEQYDIDLGVLAFGSDGWIPDKETGEPKYTKWYSDENEIVAAADSLQLGPPAPDPLGHVEGADGGPDRALRPRAELRLPRIARNRGDRRPRRPDVNHRVSAYRFRGWCSPL